jgi:hypothetical protein
MTKHSLNKQGFKLTTDQKLQLGLGSFGDFYSGISSIYSGALNQSSYNFQAWQSSVNADIARMNAQNILREGEDYLNSIRERGVKIKGEQVAAMSASGFEIGSTSYQNILQETDRNIARDTAAVKASFMSKYANQMYDADIQDIQASYYKKAGKIAKTQGYTEALFSGLSGALKLGALNQYGG